MLSLTCEAAEIVAWKVPLNHFTERGLGSTGIVLCKAAPEPSQFFKSGDVLWDLKGIPAEERIQTEPPPEWIVWNETTESLVIKADWNAIWQLHLQLRMDELPMQCRLTAEVFEVPADGSPLSEKSVPSMALSWVSRSGQDCEAIYKQDDKMIRLKSYASFNPDNSMMDLKLGVSISLPDQPTLDLESGFPFRSGSSIWAARDFDGKNGMDLRISASIELLNGTPLSHALMIQKGETAIPIVADHMQMQKHRVDDKSWLSIYYFDPANLVDQVSIDTSEEDPFAVAAPKKAQKPDCFKEVMVPEILRPWFSRPVWDLREWVREVGLDLKDENDFVGYDPLNQKIFILSESEDLLDIFESLWSFNSCGHAAMIIANLDGVGHTRLVARSGQISYLKRTIADQKEIRFLEIEPVLGLPDDLIDFRLTLRDTSVAQRIESLKTSFTLRTGRTLEVISGDYGGGKNALRLKAEVMRIP